MKRIRFEKFSLNWYRVAALILAIAFIVLGSGILANFNSAILVILGFFILLFELSRLFWYKNFVKSNSKGIYIRINSLLGKTYRFDDITHVKVTSEEMTITSKGDKQHINLNRIDRNDIDDLADILIDNSNAEYVSEVMHEQFYKKS